MWCGEIDPCMGSRLTCEYSSGERRVASPVSPGTWINMDFDRQGRFQAFYWEPGTAMYLLLSCCHHYGSEISESSEISEILTEALVEIDNFNDCNIWSDLLTWSVWFIPPWCVVPLYCTVVYFVILNFMEWSRPVPRLDVIIMERHVNTRGGTSSQLQMVFWSLTTNLFKIKSRQIPLKCPQISFWPFS